MIDSIRKKYLNKYYGQAEDLSTWFSAGLMNFKVAELLLNKYNSSHKRFALQAKELSMPQGEIKKRRINPYHLLLHKYILMFFGYSLECYLKGLLIKQKKLKPLNVDRIGLSGDCLKHLDIKMFNDAIGKPDANEEDTIKRLRRAINAGKYPIEKKSLEFYAYTAYLDPDIKETKRMINKAKRKWQELRFASEV